MSVMEAEYLAAGYQRQSRPCQALRAALIDHRIGGRNDWTDSAEVYDLVWEADQRNAYCSAAAMDLPVGGVVRFLDGEVKTGDTHYQTWFAHCVCFNATKQSNAPILERLESGRLQPFTRQGHSEFWLWREEADAFAARPGCYVEVLDGWGWRRMEPVLRPWAETMHQARAQAATVSKELESMVKLCIVAAIGRHGCRPERRSVIPISQAVEGDTVLTDCLDAQYATHTESENDAPWITPWQAYIEMTIRLANYRLQVEETERQNTVLASNVDAVYFLLPPAVKPEPDQLGGWRIREKHQVQFPYARALLSEEKTSLPGIPRGSPKREELSHALR